MLLLITGLSLFFGTHLLREFGFREGLLLRLGASRYRILYSLVALTGLALVVAGKAGSAFVMVWQPSYELRFVTHFFMLPASILVVAGNLPTSYLRKHLRHPMLLGTMLWGASHLWANGDLASMLLFGSFTVWALIKFISLNAAAQPVTKTASFTWDVFAVIIGFTLYALITIYHGQLFGIGLSFE
ncbi:MAG: NnrU family protein [Pseudohongiellaceae bacterium]